MGIRVMDAKAKRWDVSEQAFRASKELETLASWMIDANDKRWSQIEKMRSFLAKLQTDEYVEKGE